MYKQAEKPKTQLLLLFCATPVVIISLVILIAFYISLWQPNNEWTEDLTQLISATIFSTALIVLLIAEYYSIISRSEGGAVTAFIICMAPTFLFLVWLMNRTVELLGIVQPAERPNAGASIKPPILLFIIIYFVISALISLGHFRWYLKIRKYNSKILLSKDDVEYIGFGPRLAAAFTDVFIFFLLFGIVMFASLPYSFKIRSPFPLVFENLIFTALGIFFVVKFGGTPGKLILGIRIVNENRKFITVGAAILRIILYLPSFVIYFLKMRYVFANIPLTESLIFWREAMLSQKNPV